MDNLYEFLTKREGYEDVLVSVERFLDAKQKKETFVPGKTAIPVTAKVIGNLEIQAIVASALDGWLTTGRFNGLFERELASIVGCKSVLTCSSGSSANLIAFTTLCSPKLGDRRIRPGDEVISVAAGFPTTINPIIQNGAIPVFIDVSLGSLNIDTGLIERAISKKTKAIFLAHTLGNPYNLSEIKNLCSKYNLFLIEDSCDALGGTFDGKPIGSFGDLATLSFYPAHHITMGEGGAVMINNEELAKIAESIRDWGRDCYCAPGKDNTCGKRFCQKLGDLPEGYDHKYTYSHMGYNLKITDMQASCGLAQLGKLGDFVSARRNNFSYLKDKIEPLADKLTLVEALPLANPSWFGFPMTVKGESGIKRDALVQFLNGRNIGTRLLFAGNVTKQPYMKGQSYRIAGQLDNTDTVMNDTFWVATHPGLTTQMLDYIAESIHEFMQ